MILVLIVLIDIHNHEPKFFIQLKQLESYQTQIYTNLISKNYQIFIFSPLIKEIITVSSASQVLSVDFMFCCVWYDEREHTRGSSHRTSSSSATT